MVATTAELKLDGSGSLSEYLKTLEKSMTGLNKVTKDQEKAFLTLNKTGEETSTFYENLVKNVKSFYSLTKSTKQTSDLFLSSAEGLIKLDDAVDSATSGTAAFATRFLGVSGLLKNVNTTISPLAENFRDVAEAEGATAKAFVILDKTSKPVISGINLLSNQLEKAEVGFRNAEVLVAGFSQTLVSTGAKSLSFFSQTFNNLSENIANSGLIGKVFAGTFSGVAKSLDQSAKSAENFSKTITPEQFLRIDDAGEKLATTLDTTGKGLDRLAVGVRLADAIGDITRFTGGIKDSAETLQEDLTTGFSQSAAAAKFAIPLYVQMNGKLQLVATAAKAVATVTGSQLAGAVGLVSGKLAAIGAASGTFVTLGKAAADAYIQTKGLADTFDVMQRMGVDTTAASIAFQFGIVGERLLFSTNAAKEFGKTAITAFSQLEDAAAFVTTLGSGSDFQFGDLEAGVESISAAMSDLVSGPLQNTVTSLDATNALYNSLSAGVGVATDGTINLGETTDFLTASLKLASGTGADTAQTLELLAKTSKVYGLSNSEAADTAAKLYQIVEQGIVTFPQLTSQLGRTLSTAKATGVGIDEASGSIAALTKVMSADDAQTGLSSLLQSIAGQGEQAQQKLKELGVRFDVNSIKSKGLVNSLNDLYEATGGNASALKEIIPDALAFQTALTLMTSASKDAEKITQDVANSGEEMLDSVFEKRQQSTIQQFSMIMNGFNEVLIDFGRRALPAIQPGVDFLETLLGILQSLPEPIKAIIGGVIIFQTTLSNVGGGLLSFGLSIAQVVASIAAFRLATKAFSGSLGKEFDILKEINANGVDFAGTLLRLVGLNEGFDSATEKANNTLKQQKTILKELSSQNISFDGVIESSKGLNSALENTQEKIRETKERLSVLKQTSSLVDVSKTEKELQKLEGIEKRIKTFKKRVSESRVTLFSDLQSSIDTVLSSSEVTIDEKRKTLKNKLENYFRTFGSTGEKYRQEINVIFKEIISDDSLDSSAKIEKINEKFKKLGEGVSPEIKNNFSKVREELVEGIQRLDGTFSGEFSKIKDRGKALFSNLLDSKAGASVRSGMEEISNNFQVGGKKINEQIEKLLADPSVTIETKIYQINAIFDKLAANAPSAVSSQLVKLKTIITDSLLDIAVEVEQAGSEVSQEVEQLSLNLGDIASSKTQATAISNIENLKQEAVKKIEQLKNLADDSVVQLNLDLEAVGGPATKNKVEQNLANFSQTVRKETNKIESLVENTSKEINSKLSNIGESKGLGRLQGTLGSIGDLVAEFVPGVGSAMSVLRSFGDVAESAGVGTDSLANAQKRFFKENISLDLSLSSITSKLGGFGAKTSSTAAGVGLLTKAKLALAGAVKVLAGGMHGLGLATKSLVLTLGPFVAIAGIAAAALYVLHNAVKMLVPAYARATDGNERLAASIAKSDKSTVESTKKIKDMTKSLEELALVSPTALESFSTDQEKSDLADLSNAAISGLTGASNQEISKLREEVIKAIIPEEKSFIQGWRAPLVSLLEFTNKFIVDIGYAIQKLPLQLAKAGSEALSSLFEKVPIVGSIFQKTTNAIERALFGVRKEQAEFAKDNRNFFNNVRDSIQARIAAPAREAAQESRKVVEDLIFTTNKLTSAYEAGGVAFGESQDMVKNASSENRALRAEELQEILANEQELNTKAREEIQKNIESKQKELEQAKDPVVKQELQSQIDMLQERNTELEAGVKVQQQYLQNINTILQARDNNRASSGEENLLNRTQQIMEDLSDGAKQKFLEMGDLALDTEGKITGVTGNLVNSSQRKAEIAFQGARASLIQTLEDIDDPSKGINADKISTDLFALLESVDSKVAEGVIDSKTGEKLKEQYQNIGVEIRDQYGNIQTGLAKEFLLPQQLKELQARSIEALRQNAALGIEVKEAESKKIQALEEQNLISGVEAAKRQATANSEVSQLRIQAEQEVLQRISKDQGATSEDAKKQARLLEQVKLDAAVQGYNDRKKILDAELNSLQKQKDNEFKVIENAAEKEKSLLDLRTKAIGLEQQSMQASQELNGAIANLEATTLQNKLKFTGDIVEKAEIELQLATDRAKATEAEQVFERQNLELQQELNKLGLEREKIELRVQAAQLATQRIVAQAKLDQADSLNLSEAERTALQLQVDSIDQQVNLNAEQQAQLVKQEKTQEEINKKQIRSLDLRQQAARQTSAADIELAKLEKVNAEYEKQKEILRNNAREVEISGEKRLQGLKSEETILDSQASIIQKQLDLVKQTQDISQRFFEIAKATATSGFKQRRIEKEAAQERLKNLEAIQKLEQFNLAIQQQQRDLALARKEIELDVAEAKQIAALAEAEAEKARVEADPRSTEEQRRAAALSVTAQQTGLSAISSQREALGIERALNDFTKAAEQQQQQREFGLQRLEAEQAVTATTRGRSDDRAVGTRALAFGRESANQVEGLLNQQGQISTPTTPIPSLSSSGGRVENLQSASSLPSSNSLPNNPIAVSGRVEILLDVKGAADRLDAEALQKAASDGIYQGLNQLFDYSLNRR